MIVTIEYEKKEDMLSAVELQLEMTRKGFSVVVRPSKSFMWCSMQDDIIGGKAND